MLDPRRHAPATERNRDPILEVLRRVLPPEGHVLEVASGTGQHAVYFAAALEGLRWQTSDADPLNEASIAAWVAQSGLTNVLPPVHLDATEHPWPVSFADAVVCINMIHIAPWESAIGLLDGARVVLPIDGILYLYGPFQRHGGHTAPSNAAFDADLKRRDPAWGVRHLEEVVKAASKRHFVLDEVIDMPANNLSVVLRRT